MTIEEVTPEPQPPQPDWKPGVSEIHHYSDCDSVGPQYLSPDPETEIQQWLRELATTWEVIEQ